MKRILHLHVDHLRLNRNAAGLTGTLQAELAQALRQSLTAQDGDTGSGWTVATRPALRQAADHLAARLPLPDREGDT